MFDFIKDKVKETVETAGEQVGFWAYLVKGAAENKVDKSKKHIKDVIDTLKEDPAIAGRKKGYSRAAEEFGKSLKDLRKLYQQAKEFLSAEKKEYSQKAKELIAYLKILENEKERLTREKNRKIKQVSLEYNIPITEVQKAIAGRNVNISLGNSVLFVELLYRYKKKKYNEAEKLGYLESKKEFLKDIQEMELRLDELKAKGEADISKYKAVIVNVFKDIVKIQSECAELRIALRMSENE